MATLRNRAGHYIFALLFLLSFFLSFFLPHFHTWCRLSANLRCRSETCCTRLAKNSGCKSRQKITIWALCTTCPHNMVNCGLLAAQIGPVVWGTPANFNRFRVLAALLHGTVVVGVSQTLRRSTEGATYILAGWPFGPHSGFSYSANKQRNGTKTSPQPRRGEGNKPHASTNLFGFCLLRRHFQLREICDHSLSLGPLLVVVAAQYQQCIGTTTTTTTARQTPT